MGDNGKRLFLVRHATTQPHAADGDRGRQLTVGGQKEAIALGQMMQQEGFNPDLVLCSPAVRTKQTLEGVTQHLKVGKIKHADILYGGTTGDYLYALQQVSDDVQNIMVVAHNPCIYELVILLAAQGDKSLIQRLFSGYHPGSLSVVQCQESRWSDLQPAVNELIKLVNPADYNS